MLPSARMGGEGQQAERGERHIDLVREVGERDRVIDLGRSAGVRANSSRLRAVVTGAAGFVGSSLCDALLADGHEVLGIDSFTDNYPRPYKEANLSLARQCDGFRFVETDLAGADVDALIAEADVVFHQAGQPGVRTSWAAGFAQYTANNVMATQRLLEAVAKSNSVRRMVYASSSSVYGDRLEWPCTEESLPRPQSPYGVTKLAAEHLCCLYARNYGVPVVALRYFTVYGPRQRPDMAMHRLIHAATSGLSFPLFGDGTHVRDFTYIGDVVRANLLAATASLRPGAVMNIAGVGSLSMLDVIDLVGQLVGTPVLVQRCPEVPGDVQRTGGSIELAQQLLGWTPTVTPQDGLRQQIDWFRNGAYIDVTSPLARSVS